MSYWTTIPTAVRKSKRLSPEEKDLYFEICDRLNEGGYCTATNEELAKALGVSEKTITTRLATLRAKKYANTVLNLHKHQRRIYLNIPGEPSEEKRPTDKEINNRTQNFRESLKHAIVFGTIEVDVLIQKLRESTYLDDLEDNSVQFILSNDQIEFLSKFKRYQGKKIDCQVASFPNIDYKKLISSIDESLFLQASDNLSLKWFLTHSDEVLSGKYKYYAPPVEKATNFTSRQYTSNEINSLFNDIDKIEF